MKTILFIALLLSSQCFAEEAFIGYGLGVFGDADSRPSQVKIIELGYRSFMIDGVYAQLKGGVWGEGSSDSTRKSSAFASLGLGMEIDLAPVELRSGWALAGISTPDSRLGSRFPQFNGDLYLGLRDKKGSGIGVQLQHISSAGLSSPNQGRDLATLQLSQKW